MEAVISTLLGLVVLAVFAGGIGYYVYKSYRGLTPQGQATHFGLAPGETARWMWLGELAEGPSVAAKIATGAAGLVAGALLGGVGVATLRSLGVTVLVTSQRRLALIREQEDGTVSRVFFSDPREISVEHLGAGDRRIQGGPSVRYRFMGSDGVPLDVLVHESAVGKLEHWSTHG